MFRVAVVLAFLATAFSFASMGRVVTQRSLSMGIENFIGAPAKNEAGGFFDPLKLSVGKDDATLGWYRAAELKHGRVSMLATLGVIFQGYGTGVIPGFPVTEKNAFKALTDVYYTNPGALIQITLAISAVEVLCASLESKGGRPGDFGWDPAGIKPSSPEALDEMQTKELKNGRLAMLGIAGMAAQSYVTGQGTLEQLGF